MPYLLYSGRKERGKNLDTLISFFERMRKTFPDLAIDLVIIGSGNIDFCDELPEGVIDLGFVSEDDKAILMRNAVALCQPSLNESFSIVLMEAWLRETPVIVHADCSVTREHVIKSGGGLYFSNHEEFSLVVAQLLNNPILCKQFGAAGRQYVEDFYCWPAVIGRLYRAFEKFGITYDGENITEGKDIRALSNY
jgi:glycosyltransferase involved in cell wall biosynthesis